MDPALLPESDFSGGHQFGFAAAIIGGNGKQAAEEGANGLADGGVSHGRRTTGGHQLLGECPHVMISAGKGTCLSAMLLSGWLR
jgi:hypothetical protein